MATNKELIAKLMGSEKYILACAHLIALPGSPGYDREGGMKKIIDQALRDTKILLDNGVTSVLFVNEADIPYYDKLPVEGVAAFATVVNTVVNKLDIKIPYGINSIMDATTGLAVSNATGATFLRGNFFGVWATRYGLYPTQAANLFRMKSNLGMTQQEPPYFFCNIGDAGGNNLTGDNAVEQAKVHALDIHAQAHGWSIKPNDLDLVRQVKEATPDFPVVVASSTKHENLKELLEVFDGTIVASCLHEDGKLFGKVDAERTERFMKIFRSI
jgi:membrane complex biogenesis BtpA family protein